MRQLAQEIHTQEYCNNELRKLDLRRVESLIPFNIVLKQGYLDVLDCNICGIGLMTQIPDCGLKYVCSDCDNVEILKEKKPFYQFNFKEVQKILIESLTSIASNTQELGELKIKKSVNFWLANLETWKINFYFFHFEKDFTSFKLHEAENHMIFTPFSEDFIKTTRNIFFIDIYEFFELNDLQKKIKINENKFKYMIFKVISEIMLGISKTNKTFINQAAKFWVLGIANNKAQLLRYKEIGGRELFIRDIQNSIKNIASDYAEKLWKEEIKPFINL